MMTKTVIWRQRRRFVLRRRVERTAIIAVLTATELLGAVLAAQGVYKAACAITVGVEYVLGIED